jgi:GTPase SAR1 family protein
MEITRGIIKGAQKIVIYGPEGIGKSSLAAQFPNPVFIDVEDSTKHMDIARTPKPSSWAMLTSQIAFFKNNPQACDTLIIDTADWAEKLCISHVCSKCNKTGIEDFGYGKGYIYLVEEFGRFLNLLSELIELGINVVMTAHAQMRKFEQPDEMGAYDRYEFKLEKKTAPLVKEWADMVLFMNYKTFVVNSGNDGKGTNKVQGGKRVVYTTHHACWDAKNRHGLPEELTFNSPEDGWRQIAHCITTRDDKSISEPAEQPLALELDEAPEASVIRPGARQTFEDEVSKIVTGIPDKKTPDLPKQEPTKQSPPALTGVPKPLADLMTENHVTMDEIQNVVAQRGYFPADTPFENYPKDFIDGCLIGAWPQVFKIICDNRK